jgi:hypothetical protein
MMRKETARPGIDFLSKLILCGLSAFWGLTALAASTGELSLPIPEEDALFITTDEPDDSEMIVPEPVAKPAEESLPLPSESALEEGADEHFLGVGEDDTFSREAAADSPLGESVAGDEAYPEGEEVDFPEEVDIRGELLRAMAEGEIDSRFELFRGFEPISEWSAAIEWQLREVFPLLEQDPAKARVALRRLSGQIVRNDFTETSLMTSEERLRAEKQHHRRGNFLNRENSFAKARASEKYGGQADAETAAKGSGLELRSPEERVAIVRAFRHSLDRRVYLWTAASDYFDGVPLGGLPKPRTITAKETAALKEKTVAVQNYFGVTPAALRWRKNFEIDALYAVLQRLESNSAEDDTFFRPYLTADLVPENEGRKADLALLRDHINSICLKIESPSLTESQKAVFRHAVPQAWYQMLRTMVGDQSDPYAVLSLYEEYERGGGGDTGRELGRAAYRMKTSPFGVSRHLGEAIGTIYNNPNLKVYVSQAFINRFLPIRDPEFDVVQERILGNPVAGSRRTDTQVRIQLVPDKSRLLMNLVVVGRIVASTKSEVFPAKIFNESYANYVGVKQLEWGDRGMTWSDSQVNVSNTNMLSDVRTNIDFVPILGGLTREVVKGEYQSQQEALRQETRGKIEAEVRRRIDTESTDRFMQVNNRLTDGFYSRLNELGLNLTLQDSRTTDDWLLASLRLSEPGSLGSQTAEPPTLRGAYADLKIHESALNTLLSRLDLGGRGWRPEELAEHVAAKFRRTAPKIEYNSDLWVEFEMKETDPVSISFQDNRIRLRLRFEYIELGDESWDDVEAVVTYTVQDDENGVPHLVREGVIGISGPMNIRAQIPLRGLFSKIFAPETRVALRPKVFDRDERFAGLSTGLCRISDGWFAVSVTEAPNAHGTAGEYPRLKALRDRLAQKPRPNAGLR